MLIDTHCHLDCEPLVSRLSLVLDEARRAGVGGFVVPGVHPGGWDGIAALVREHEGMAAAFGVHPMHADLLNDALLAELESLAGSMIAVGEIGLDPLYPVSLARQERAFREQLRLALAAGKPVLVHCRRLFGHTLDILRQEGVQHVGGIMHAYSGSPEMARQFIRLGFKISLCGTLTWQGAVRPVRVAREIPLEHLVLESDAPDLTPQRYRGQPNQPGWLRETVAALAGIRGMPVEDVARSMACNTLRILGGGSGLPFSPEVC